MASVLRSMRLAAAAPRVIALNAKSASVSSARFFSSDKSNDGEGKAPYKNRWYVAKDKKAAPVGATDDALYNLSPEDQVPDEHTDLPTLPEGHTFTLGEGAYEETLEYPQRLNQDELAQLVENQRDFVMDDEDDDDDDSPSLQDKSFNNWDQGDVYLPEMMNWMLPRHKRTPMKPEPKKAWTEFVKADLDPVELALNTDLLRLFISPNGRIVPRRFTGLRAKQQRQLTAAVKVSRQIGLLPYTSRYPLPSPNRWKP
ncbi:hypothetical protein SPRG_01789 [Saprolegnia parasitica CBS 223.65]|uniref:Ribosomal protein S18 n=1 Tax=Saprolegnia parasitica (strain CBS 223.65) TaxID=695850 RepID=A0A067CT70_SAPPC|nr:hypothetical protein SPRG_01789 [Saprolegnia parasitica CBS 223.65]KDO33909.1 hypothetical protein SPRG_01789 [Saprolegnia parasitica CBS 223.65]|eukprot:XP_012195545.1 hypothetical protein SPRG_01789 [Saprolegnia parasitica CBS 223.65]